MTRRGLLMLGKENQLDEAATQRLLDALAPALGLEAAKPAGRITLASPRRDASVLAEVWRSLGSEVVINPKTPDAADGDVIMVADFVIEPDHHHAWLRLDVPHTPIVFSDQSVVVGPRVVPGHTACLHCVRIAHNRDNPHAVALASQLWGTRAASASSELQALAAWHCYQLIHWGDPGQVLRIDAHTHAVYSRVIEPEPECACISWD
jgi:hypothetical protein